MTILFRNVQMVDCLREQKADLLIRDGLIVEIGNEIIAPDATVINANYLTVMPSFIDLHAHFRDPGFTHKEDVLSGCLAAVHGGYTAVNLMPNTKPVITDLKSVQYVEQKAQEQGLCDVYQTAAITRDFDGKTLSHLEELAGHIRFLTDDGNGVEDSKTIWNAMVWAKEHDIGLMLHEEERFINRFDSYLSEELPTFRDSRFAYHTGCRTHFSHVSTKRALDFIWEAKQAGAPVTLEVAPHHIALNDENGGRVAPPLRSEFNRLALIKAIKEGKVDALATDHAPHTPEEKAAGANGFTGLDFSFATCYTVLCVENKLPLTSLSRLLSYGPASILKIHGGLIEVGQPANLVLVDLMANYIACEEQIVSRSKNSPILGRSLWGEVVMTLKRGKVVYEKGVN